MPDTQSEDVERLLAASRELADDFERTSRALRSGSQGGGGGGGGGGGAGGGLFGRGGRGGAGARAGAGLAGSLGKLAGGAIGGLAAGAAAAVANQAKRAAKTAAFRFADSAVRFGFGPGGISTTESAGDAASAALAGVPILGIKAKEKRDAINDTFSRVKGLTTEAARAGINVTDEDRLFLASVFGPEEIRAQKESKAVERLQRKAQGRVSINSQGADGDMAELNQALRNMGADIRQSSSRGFPTGPRAARLIYSRSSQ